MYFIVALSLLNLFFLCVIFAFKKFEIYLSFSTYQSNDKKKKSSIFALGWMLQQHAPLGGRSGRKNKYVFLILYLVLTPCDMNLPMLLKYCDHKQD